METDSAAKQPPYQWTQTLRDVTLTLPLPEGLSKRGIKVHFKPTHLRVEFKGEAVVDGELQRRVKCEDSTWYLEDGKLCIELLKSKGEEWWPSVCVGDPEVDTTKLQPEDSSVRRVAYRRIRENWVLTNAFYV